MKGLIHVYNAIDDEKISIFPYKIPFDVPAITLEVGGDYGIFVDYDRINSLCDEFMILSHEYGHCTTGTTHPIGCDIYTKSKHECKANRKSVTMFLPVEKIIEAFSAGCVMPYEVSEYLDLPEKFVIMAFEHYKAMGKI